jgi:hypothetical protein
MSKSIQERLKRLEYLYKCVCNSSSGNGGGGGGTGAVSSVNTKTGAVVLNQDDVLDGTTYKQYSQTEKIKLAGIAAGAEVNVNADWNAVSGDAFIQNKPTIPSSVFGSYSMRVNNTNASANPTETVYRSNGIAVYTGGIVFTAGTAPSGTTNHSYNWIQIGNLVILNMNLFYSTAGATVQNITMAFPSDCPTPLVQTGMPNIALTKHYVGSGRLSAGTLLSTNSTPECILRKNSTNTGFEIYMSQSGAAFSLFQVTIQYFV